MLERTYFVNSFSKVQVLFGLNVTEIMYRNDEDFTILRKQPVWLIAVPRFSLT